MLGGKVGERRIFGDGCQPVVLAHRVDLVGEGLVFDDPQVPGGCRESHEHHNGR
jgi:hypothetical protein